MSDRLTYSVTTARVMAGASSDALLAIARERAFDAAVLDERAPFFWLNEISSNRMDAYFGYMDAETTLPNFAADAAEGRAFLAGHNTRSLPLGYTLTGSVERGEVTRVLADAYTLRGLDLSSVETDSFIDGIRAGVIRDVSVGFTLGADGWYRCNVCGNDLNNWEKCRHWPGMTYEEQDADRVVRQITATFTVIDGRLSEVSAVYDGATPSAGIVKAQDGARMGLLDDRTREFLEQRYRCVLPDRAIRSVGVTVPAPIEETTDVATIVMESAEGRTVVERTVPTAPVLLTQNEIRAILALPDDADPLIALHDLAAELPALRRDAEAGRAYRASLITDALGEAVRALGAEAHDRYAPVLANLSLDAVRAMRDDWASLAAQRFPGGRVTVERGEDPPLAAAPVTAPPADVYRAG
jgi:hypothetical protein